MTNSASEDYTHLATAAPRKLMFLNMLNLVPMGNGECEVALSDTAPISGMPTRGCTTGKLEKVNLKKIAEDVNKIMNGKRLEATFPKLSRFIFQIQ